MQDTLLPSDPQTINTHPAIEAVMPEMLDAFSQQRNIYGEDEQAQMNADVAAVADMADFIEQQAVDSRHIVSAAAALYVETDKVDAPAKFMRKLLTKYVAKSALDNTDLVEQIAEGVTHYIRRLEIMEQCADSVLPQLDEAGKADSQFGFGLLRLLGDPVELVSSDGQDSIREGVGILTAVDHFRLRRTGPSFIDRLKSQVEGGAFDSLLATDLLETIKADPYSAGNQGRLQSLQRMSGLLLVAGMTEVQAAEVITSPEGILQWPTRLRSALQVAGQDHIDAIDRRLDTRRKMLEQRMVLLPRDPERLFDSKMTEFIKLVQLMNGGRALATVDGRRLTHADAVATRARIRRNGRGYNGDSNGTGASEEGVAESPLLRDGDPRELYFINNQGDYYPSKDGKTADVVEEYVKKHGGGSKELTEALYNLFETIQLVDFSKGIIKGAIPHVKEFKVNGVVVGTLWQIRPDKLPRTKDDKLGKHARKLRVFCTIDNARVGIYALLDKDEVHKFKRDHGIGQATRRNK